MLGTLDYNLDDDPDAVVRLNAIRLGAGHLDMANDLLANADQRCSIRACSPSREAGSRAPGSR